MTSLSLYCFFAIVAYFLLLVTISFFRARNATLSDYLIGNRNSVWWLVTLSMISDSVSGVTYISVPGMVSTHAYSYLQIVFGYFLGYLVITFLLLPLYYRMSLVSIYSYLGERFGESAQKTASVLFIASRTFGSAARLYLAVLILHQFLFADLFSPLFSFLFAMILIIFYTYKGGIKSLVWTEAFQSVFLIAGITVAFAAIFHHTAEPWKVMSAPQLFFWDPRSSSFFWKQLIGGMFITISMNGLDQNIMQINLSCRSLREAQKNMLWSGILIVFVNVVFLGLGALTLHFYESHGLAIPTADQLLPDLVLQHFNLVPILFFTLGLTAASFSSASSVLTAIASSIEIDLLPKNLQNKIPVRTLHVFAGLVILAMIALLYLNHTESLISVVLKYAGYTYGPILGLFTLGIFSKRKARNRIIPWIALASMTLTIIVDHALRILVPSYHLGVELLPMNAIIFIGLMMISSGQ